jgi:hypothetical protein
MHVIVGRAVEAIAFLFSLFGGFLTAIAPPDEAEAKFAVGLSSVVSLLIFLIITVFVRLKSSQAKGILCSVAIALAIAGTVSGFVYHSKLRELIFEWPPEAPREDHIAGTEFTPEAKEYLSQNPGLPVAQLVAKFGGLGERERVWARASQQHAANVLTIWYVIFIVTIFGCVFCLTEGVLSLLGQSQSQGQHATQGEEQPSEEVEPSGPLEG